MSKKVLKITRFGRAGDTSMTDSDNPIARLWLSTTEVQQMTGLSRTEVYAALYAGELEGHQRAKHKGWRIHVDAVDRWMRGETAISA